MRPRLADLRNLSELQETYRSLVGWMGWTINRSAGKILGLEEPIHGNHSEEGFDQSYECDVNLIDVSL